MRRRPRLDDIEIPDWAGPLVRRWHPDPEVRLVAVVADGRGLLWEGDTAADAAELADDAARRGHLVNVDGREVVIFQPLPHRTRKP